MTVVHIVSFAVKDPKTLPSLSQALRKLQTTCVRASDGKPYILSLKGGKQRSNECKDKGMQATFIMEMENDDDLQYYLWKDPAHADFKHAYASAE